jgi:hypothetical protein
MGASRSRMCRAGATLTSCTGSRWTELSHRERSRGRRVRPKARRGNQEARWAPRDLECAAPVRLSPRALDQDGRSYLIESAPGDAELDLRRVA